jgi:uncharacterized repeat protein (TIGR01451 family)
MHDVAMRRMLAALVIAAAVALLVVSGAMLFGMGKPAQAQSDPEPPCTFNFCLDKTADPNPATVGEPITFTITERCVAPSGCFDIFPLVDQLPSGLTVDSVAPAAVCSASGNTVTCGGRSSSPTAPFTLTIVATPTECGSFTNTASHGGGTTATATATFTVVRCPPPTKEECKNGGWEVFGFPNQGTCVSAVNQNRP